MPSQSLVAPDAASLEFELAHAILDSNRSCLLRLSSQNLSQLALAWCLANPIVTSVIIGAQTWDQHAEKLGVSEWSGTLRMSGPWMRWSTSSCPLKIEADSGHSLAPASKAHSSCSMAHSTSESKRLRGGAMRNAWGVLRNQ